MRRRRWLAAATALALLPSILAQPALAQGGPRISIIRDTEIEEIIHKEAEPMWRAAGLNPDDIRIVVMGDRDPNAFTAGGTTIYITSGLIEKTLYPNQLVGVLAHETGHIVHGDVARQNAYKPALATYLLTMGLGILAAVAGAPDAGAGLMYSADYFASLTALNYSREQESQADQAAAGFLEKARMSGRGLVEFFDNYRYQEVFDNYRKYRFFLDHPLSAERIDSMKARMTKSPYYNQVDTPQALADHVIMVAKLRALMDLPQQTFVDYKETDASIPARYARAIAYYEASDAEKAFKLADSLIADYPDNPYFYELKGEMLFDSARPKEAAEALTHAVALNPDAPLLQVKLGRELLAQEDKTKVDDAILHLKAALRAEQDNAEAWFILAQAYDAKGDAGRAHWAAAEEDFHLGQMRDARDSAVRARESLDKGSVEYTQATDIILASRPSAEEMQAIARQDGKRAV